jgi:IclR family transcriptional regulator, KDG regulon repressor
LNSGIFMDIDNKQVAVQSIARAANILTCISNGVNSITDIATYCGINKSSAHRLLQALVESNLVTRDPVKRQYYLGYLVTHLIFKPEITHEYLTICASEELKHLAELTGETVSFGLMIALRYLNLQSISSKYDLRVIEEPKEGGSIYAGASGRVLLSQLGGKDLKTALRCMSLYPSINIEKEKLMDQIKLIRQQGYAISANEQTDGAMCMAAAIKNYKLPATIYILGPESRMKPRTKEYIAALLNCANRISQNIELYFEIK